MSEISLSLLPTSQNIEDAIRNDTLGNNKWIYNFLNLFLEMENAILAVNGKWGCGKSFLAKEIQEIINVKFENQSGNELDSYVNNDRYLKALKPSSCYSIYYNVWDYDNDNDPMASFLYFLIKYLNVSIKGDKFRNIAKNLIENVIEKLTNGWIKFSDKNETNDLEKVLSSVLTSEYIFDEIGKLLQEIRSEKYNKLIVIIDELDRCRPTYALKFLEMLNRYFRRDGVLVLCMTDYEQLLNIIKCNYGTKTNANLYLDKMFDLIVKMPTNNTLVESYLLHKVGYDYDDSYAFDMFVTELIKEKNLTLRNIDRFVSYIKPLFKRYKKDDGFGYNDSFINCFFAPYLIETILFDNDEYVNLINGNFDGIIRFSKRPRVLERIQKFYPNTIQNQTALDLEGCLKSDLLVITAHMRDKNVPLDKLKFGRISYNATKYIVEIDLLSMFIERVSSEKNEERI